MQHGMQWIRSGGGVTCKEGTPANHPHRTQWRTYSSALAKLYVSSAIRTSPHSHPPKSLGYVRFAESKTQRCTIVCRERDVRASLKLAIQTGAAGDETRETVYLHPKIGKAKHV